MTMAQQSQFRSRPLWSISLDLYLLRASEEQDQGFNVSVALEPYADYIANILLAEVSYVSASK